MKLNIVNSEFTFLATITEQWSHVNIFPLGFCGIDRAKRKLKSWTFSILPITTFYSFLVLKNMKKHKKITVSNDFMINSFFRKH